MNLFPFNRKVNPADDSLKLKNLIAQGVNCQINEISLVNPKPFLAGNDRYLYVFVEPADGKMSSFIKVARKKAMKERLRREGVGQQIANQLDINTLHVFSPYQKLNSSLGLYHRENLELEDGILLATLESVSEASPTLGKIAAQLLISFAGRKILPKSQETKLLKRNDWRNKSARTFWPGWRRENQLVLDPLYDAVREKLIKKDRLLEIIKNTEDSIRPLIKMADKDKNEYFVHNDTAPSNMFFKRTGKDQYSALLLDFEYAGATHNSILAKLTDLGNYYGRCWPNPLMQQEFLVNCLERSPLDSLETSYLIARGAAVFGAMYLAQFKLDDLKVRQAMYESLLGNLEENLACLDQAYIKLRQTKPTISIGKRAD